MTELDQGLLGDSSEPTFADEPPAAHDVEPSVNEPEGDETDPPPGPYFANVYEFVHEFLVKLYAKTVREGQSGFRWCAQWYFHTEAVARLEALWKAFEALRLDPGTGASTWWRDHADPCMAALTADTGPFTRCGPESHHAPPPLPAADPPDWLLRTET